MGRNSIIGAHGAGAGVLRLARRSCVLSLCGGTLLDQQHPVATHSHRGEGGLRASGTITSANTATRNRDGVLSESQAPAPFSTGMCVALSSHASRADAGSLSSVQSSDSSTLPQDLCIPAREKPTRLPSGLQGCTFRSASSPSPSQPHESASHSSRYTVRVVDRFGMPAELLPDAPHSLADLLLLCPPSLRERVAEFAQSRGWTEWTCVQRHAIPCALEGRDVLWVAPPSTGKTFSYVFPCVLRMARSEAEKQTHLTGGCAADAASWNSPSLQRDVTRALRSSSASACNDDADRVGDGGMGNVLCRYCELDVRVTRVCPMTGLVHAHPSESADDDLASSEAGNKSRALTPRWLSELSTVAEPRVLVLVPTAVLATQVQRIFAALGRGSFRARALVRASSADEQRAFLHSLSESDVLISTPETILPALLRHKLSLRRVQTLVLDEVDTLVSVNYFEPVKMILAALPRHAARPQRLLCGASLPPVVYRMLRDRMLLPTHRFVLVDVARNALGQVDHRALVADARRCAMPSSGARAPSEQKGGQCTAGGGDGEGAPCAMDTNSVPTKASLAVEWPTSALHTHVVFMLGRVEKMHKLAWMYQSGLLHPDQRTIVFCNSRHNVGYVHDKLAEMVPNVRVCTMHSRTSATARRGVLRMFESGVASCLVCTDLLSRGVDFEKVVYVVHYDMPAEMETWMHRSGRCGRQGTPGYVYTFFQPENVKLSKPLVAFLRQHQQPVPPKLQEYAKQSFVDVFTSSLFNSPTRPYRASDPQVSTPVLTRGRPRFPDYRQSALQKHFRPS